MGHEISIDHLTVEFRGGALAGRAPVRALDDVTLRLPRGRTLGLVGESGSGKSTLGQILVGLLQPTGGTVSAESDLGSRRRRSGDRQLVGQNPRWALNPRLRVWRSVAEPLAIAGVRRTERRAAALDALRAVGLGAEFATRFPHQLSGGQLQRAAIARALVGTPQLVVFDEAVSALDVSVQVQTINIIRELQAKLGFTALFISHDLPSVRYASSDVAVLYRGVLMHTAPVDAFYGRPLHPYSLALQTAEEPGSPFALRAESEGTASAPADGCPLAGRCPLAVAVCAERKPSLQLLDGQQSACHRAAEMHAATDPATLITRPAEPLEAQASAATGP